MVIDIIWIFIFIFLINLLIQVINVIYFFITAMFYINIGFGRQRMTAHVPIHVGALLYWPIILYFLLKFFLSIMLADIMIGCHFILNILFRVAILILILLYLWSRFKHWLIWDQGIIHFLSNLDPKIYYFAPKYLKN